MNLNNLSLFFAIFICGCQTTNENRDNSSNINDIVKNEPRCIVFPIKIDNFSNTTQEGFPIKRVAPKYPKSAARDKINGYVKFEFDISSEGKPFNIGVMESSPSDLFIKPATEALEKWRFNPYKENGLPIDSICQSIQLDFKV
ncbi:MULTISPECIES: energy transducer TonB [unclassified Colwellia]|uniref:energy transducer TonB n=1 Tax=unclassified Colwellia TaxID=196834 RepID=UPI0015F4AF2C|nr:MULTISPECIES: energy transducer TonB [unclassified Colwellia]MBA6231407.1 energy transducer TonB [Colwellia sp. MB02u-7]MBA6237567.1 energy transducer TonB [Colwellia sp. MB02u-11]MBA6258011.1 energy transducer TonB [Colwellia sp. MB3u-28]MBA6258707.1 energy transducer TonB [Colwellia sp. MB3u-41]MBA6298767.1 energy transducer TonB [Colwellia sp. MB3u-22]